MEVRLKTNHEVRGHADHLNPHGFGEIVVRYPDGDASSEYIREHEVKLAGGQWVDMSLAFRHNDLITDNTSVSFREPRDDAERQRGWYD